MTELWSFKRQISGVSPTTIFDIYGFPVTNSTLFMVLVLVFIGVFSFLAFRKKKEVPNKIQLFFEIVYESVHSQINTITNSEYHTKRIFPLIASVFIFIGISNYMGLIPGLSSITWNGASIFRTTTGDFNTTFGLAFGALILLHFVTIKDLGVGGYILKFVPIKQLRQDIKNGVLSPIYVSVTILMACLDIVGEFAKVLSTSLRLFGNMYAGDVLMTVLVGIFAFVLPSFWVAFGMLGALIQTIVFGSLITLYYMQASGPEPGTSKS